MKVLFEAKDEPNLERPARETAAGAILHILSADNGGAADLVEFAADAIVLREALAAIVSRGGEGAAAFRERFGEYYATLDSDLGNCRSVVGDSYRWFGEKIAGLHRLVYKGKRVSHYIDDEEACELLYEDGLAFATDYPIDEEKLEMRLKRVDTLLDPLRRKATQSKKKTA
ncbi:MAG: hypothetical protein V2A73_08140 [Pseudomonadota bacterium]